MNTGTEIETKRLILLPGSNRWDAEPFLKMLREDGDFQEFCGVEFSEKNLLGFAYYFERMDHEECVYGVFPKEMPEEFIGYVGFHREQDGDYEIEFYIAKKHRRKGYCEEACKAVMKLVFGYGLSVDHHRLSVDRLYATTLDENAATIGVLKKLGFQRDIAEDGSVLIMQAFVDEDDDDLMYFNTVVKMVVEK